MSLRMASRRIWPSCVLFTCASFGTVTSHAQPAATGDSEGVPGSPIRVLSWNIYGAVRGGPPVLSPDCESFKGNCASPTVDRDGFAFLDIVADRIAEHQPHFVTLQEVCGSQANVLADRLVRRSFPMKVFLKYNPRGFEPRCPDFSAAPGAPGDQDFSGDLYPPGSFGKAVLVRADIEAEPNFAGPAVDTCITVTSMNGLQVCSIHTGIDDIGNVAGALNNVILRDGPTIAAGDYNLKPEDSSLDAMYYADPGVDRYSGYGNFYEASQPCAQSAHSPVTDLPAVAADCRGKPGRLRVNGETTSSIIIEGHGQIDLVFADRIHFDHTYASSWQETPLCGALLCSDHDMIVADLVLKPPAAQTGIAGEWKGAGFGDNDDTDRGATLVIEPDLSVVWYTGGMERVELGRGKLVAAGEGRYSLTLSITACADGEIICEPPAFDYEITVIECAAADPTPHGCALSPGPLELFVQNKMFPADQDQFWRP